MKLLVLESKNPYYNLAIEEYLFKTETDDIFIIWQNEPTIVIGKNQNVFAEINKAYTEKNKIHIVRRITGGGAVYHDLGNVNYSFIASSVSGDINFKYFTAPIIEALNSLGIVAMLTGRNDLEVGGKKISGNAQHREGSRVLHHGTLLFDTDLDVLTKALNVDEEKIKAKALKSTHSRVINLKELLNTQITSKDFINIIAEFIVKKYSPDIISAPASEKISELKRKYESYEWTYPNRDFLSSYTIVKKRKYDFGIVNIELHMSNDVINDIKIHGDFFGTVDISELEDFIRGKKLNEIEKIFETIEIEKYIFGAKNNIILQQILS